MHLRTLIVGGGGFLAVAWRARASPVGSACVSLQNKYPQSVYLPDAEDYVAEVTGKLQYFFSTLYVWSETCLTTPSCAFEPNGTEQLADGLAIIVAAKSKFSVRSRGHMPVPGSNGVNGGVFISLSNFNQKTLLPGNEIIQIGPGQPWADVYRYVSPYGKGVAGGRFSPVGVGGLLLGGGINYFGSQVGFSCDTVKNYEVVLANSSIVYANATSNADLFWALKGGSNAFGIVTRFDMQTVPATEIYGGVSSFAVSQGLGFLDAITNYTLPGGGSYDSKSAILPTIGIDAASKSTSYSLVSFYDGADATPSALAQFAALNPPINQNSVHSSFSNYTELTDTAAFSDETSRWLFASTAIKVSKDSVGLLNQTFVETVESRLNELQNKTSTFTLSIQPITTAWLQASKDSGGNAIDLDPNNGPFISVLIVSQWQDRADDAVVNSISRQFISNVDAASQAAGLFYGFQYLNDAQAGQEIYAFYGGGNSLPRLKEVQQAYDPDGVLRAWLQTGFPL